MSAEVHASATFHCSPRCTRRSWVESGVAGTCAVPAGAAQPAMQLLQPRCPYFLRSFWANTVFCLFVFWKVGLLLGLPCMWQQQHWWGSSLLFLSLTRAGCDSHACLEGLEEGRRSQGGRRCHHRGCSRVPLPGERLEYTGCTVYEFARRVSVRLG